MNATRSAGVIDSSTIRKAMLTDSSSVTRSAGSVVPPGHRGQPGAWVFDGLLLLPGHGVPAGVGLLDGVLGLSQGAQQPVGEVDQLTPPHIPGARHVELLETTRPAWE